VVGAPEQVEAVVAEDFDDVYRAGHDRMVRLAYLMVGSVGCIATGIESSTHGRSCESPW
jgi:hypothetical protein